MDLVLSESDWKKAKVGGRLASDVATIDSQSALERMTIVAGQRIWPGVFRSLNNAFSSVQSIVTAGGA